MPPLTQPNQISERLTEWLDLDYHDGLYRKMQYVFGRSWDSKWFSPRTGGGRFPDYADIILDFLDIGASRRILNTQFKAMAKTMYSDLSPEFPQVPKHIGEVRKQFWLARAGGHGYGDGEWADEFSSAFMEGDGLGAGHLEIGLETNPASKQQRVTVRHSPTILTIVDRTQPKFSKARGICFVKYLSPDVAFDLYGKNNVKQFVRPLHDTLRAQPLNFVRIFDYWDIGYGLKGKPTHAVMPGDFTEKPLFVEENPFGCLPWSWYTHFYAPGMRQPVGRIVMQQGTQEAINEVERHLREVVQKGSGIDLVDVTQLHPDDVRRWRKGEKMTQIRLKQAIPNENHPPVIRIQSQEVAAALLELMQLYERQYNDDGNTTEYDRGNLSAARRTATETELLAQRTQDSGNWGTLQAAKMYRRTVERVLQIAAKFDRDPVTLDVFGVNLTVNDPDQPSSTIEAYLQEPSKVVIDADDLTYQDTRQKMALRMETLKSYQPLVQAGVMPLDWYAEEIVRAGGDDPSECLQPQPPPTEKPQEKITDIIDSKLAALLTPMEFAQYLQHIGITPDPARQGMQPQPPQPPPQANQPAQVPNAAQAS